MLYVFGSGSLALPSQSATSRSGSGYASGRSNVALTMLNMVVFAPMPRASVATATAMKPGLRLHIRTAYRTSLRKVRITPGPEQGVCRKWTSDYRLQTTDYRLQTTDVGCSADAEVCH